MRPRSRRAARPGQPLLSDRRRHGGAEEDRSGHDPLFCAAEAEGLGAPTETVFLGLLDGAARFALALPADARRAACRRAPISSSSICARSRCAASSTSDHLAALAEGKALLNWHARHRFCPNCGAATRAVEAGWRRDCPACRALHFPRTDPVVIMLAIAGERCLLGRSHRFQSGMWSCLAGFVEPGETIEEAVRRETREEAGIVCGEVAYFASQPWPFPMSLMIGCYAQARSRDDRRRSHRARRRALVRRARRSPRCWLGRHPDGLTAPLPHAIAHHILRAFVERDIEFD